jgi:methionyl-tRNA synthetase
MSFNDKQNTFSITTPLYYVNDLPHIGSAYTTIAVDVISRFQRLQGKSVLMVTGTDEHGQKIQRTAEAAGRSPQEHCDQVAIASSAPLIPVTPSSCASFFSASGTKAISI